VVQRFELLLLNSGLRLDELKKVYDIKILNFVITIWQDTFRTRRQVVSELTNAEKGDNVEVTGIPDGEMQSGTKHPSKLIMQMSLW